jgi:hypothetical protein
MGIRRSAQAADANGKKRAAARGEFTSPRLICDRSAVAIEIEAAADITPRRKRYFISTSYCPLPTLYTRRTAPPSTGIAAPLM